MDLDLHIFLAFTSVALQNGKYEEHPWPLYISNHQILNRVIDELAIVIYNDKDPCLITEHRTRNTSQIEKIVEVELFYILFIYSD